MIHGIGVDSFPEYHNVFLAHFNLCFLNTATVITVEGGYLFSTINFPPSNYGSVRIAYDIASPKYM